jgi:hypothetical protein
MAWFWKGSRYQVFGDLVVLAFLLSQAADGVLTYVGISTFGPSVEGNPLIGRLMLVVGFAPAVASAKLVAASFGVVLHLFGVHRIVALLTGLYVAAAIIPWMALLYFSGAY